MIEHTPSFFSENKKHSVRNGLKHNHMVLSLYKFFPIKIIVAIELYHIKKYNTLKSKAIQHISIYSFRLKQNKYKKNICLKLQ